MWSLDRLLVSLVVALVVIVVLYYTPPGRALIARMYRKRAANLSARRQAEVLLRVTGPPESRVRWRYGLVTLFPGRVDFVSYVGGLWFLKRRPLFYEVVAIGEARPPRGTEKLRGNPKMRIVALSTPAATLEVAVIPPFHLDQVLAQLSFSG